MKIVKKSKIILIFIILLFSINILYADEFDNEFDDDLLQDDNSITLVKDPLEPFNRAMFSTYKFLYDYGVYYIVIPYQKSPSFIKNRATSFVDNLSEPLSFVNHVLQARFNAAAETLMRFSINSSLGLLGLWDVMSYFGMERKANDFGATAYFYGVPAGPPLLLMGFMSLRDNMGTFFHILTSKYYFPGGELLAINKKQVYCTSYFDCTTDTIGPIAISYRSVLKIIQYGNLYESNKDYLNSSLDPYSLFKVFSLELRKEYLDKIATYD